MPKTKSDDTGKDYFWYVIGACLLFIIGYPLLLIFINPWPPPGSIETCGARIGFICNQAAYSHTTGNITATIGQSSGVDWTSWGLAFAKEGTLLITDNVPQVEFISISNPPKLQTGQTVSLGTGIIQVSGAVPIGTSALGILYACYTLTTSPGTLVGAYGSCTSTNATVHYAQIATLDLKAT